MYLSQGGKLGRCEQLARWRSQVERAFLSSLDHINCFCFSDATCEEMLRGLQAARVVARAFGGLQPARSFQLGAPTPIALGYTHRHPHALLLLLRVVAAFACAGSKDLTFGSVLEWGGKWRTYEVGTQWSWVCVDLCTRGSVNRPALPFGFDPPPLPDTEVIRCSS